MKHIIFFQNVVYFAYQINVTNACSSMVENSLPVDTHNPVGDGVKIQDFQNMVMLYTK